MVRELKFLTVVEHTAYFFCKELNYLLPVPISNRSLTTLIEGCPNNLCVQLTLDKLSQAYKVKTNLEDFLALLTQSDSKIEIDEKVLLKKGVFVTKTLIKEALTTT